MYFWEQNINSGQTEREKDFWENAQKLDFSAQKNNNPFLQVGKRRATWVVLKDVIAPFR